VLGFVGFSQGEAMKKNIIKYREFVSVFRASRRKKEGNAHYYSILDQFSTNSS
jgi:hypothetical protein